MTTSFDIWLARRPFKTWAEAEAHEPFELRPERRVIKGRLTQPLAGGRPMTVNIARAGTPKNYVPAIIAPLLLALLMLLPSSARADETCVAGEVGWEMTETGAMEARPLQGLYLSMTPIPGNRAVLFTVAFLQVEVVCAATITPGITATIGCAFPGANATFTVKGNGEAVGEVCVPKEPEPKPSPPKKQRAKKPAPDRSTYDATC